MKSLLIGGAATVGAVGTLYFLFAPDDLRPVSLKSEFEQFCLQCEEVLQDRLRSPSTYTRIECSEPYTETADQAQFIQHDRLAAKDGISEWTQRDLDNGDLLITTAFLKYEAANGFGTPIAGLEACTTDHRIGTSFISEYNISGPNVAGYSKTGWLIQQLTDN